MLAATILASLAFVFAALAAYRRLFRGRERDPSVRTWTIIAFVFATVAAWLFERAR